jgi:hypothetical protein
MMQYHQQKRKYKSLIISCIIHGLICLALIYYTLYQTSQQDLAESLKELMPAPVSLAPLRPDLPEPEQSGPRQRRVLPFESSQTEELNDNPAIPYGEQLEQFNTLENPYQEVAEPNKEHQESNDVESNVESQEEHGPSINHKTSEGTFPSQNVTTREFLQAFKKALHQEHPPEAVNDPQILVQQRLGRQWGQASYTSRALQALNKSFRANARSIKHHEFIKKDIVVTLGILKDGTAEDLDNQPLSGIPELDRHIRHVVRETTFPPIPDRFQTDIYHLHVTIQVVLLDGAIMFGKNFEVTMG